MRPNILLALSAALLLPAPLIAQDDSQGAARHYGKGGEEIHHAPYPHYKVIDTGSFGGPNGHIHLGAHVLNNAGALTVSADTPDTDSYASYSQDWCFNGDCLVTHTAKWKKGELEDLDVIGAGPNSEPNWLSESGLIAGDSQNGMLDPLVGFWELWGVLWKHNKLIEVGTLGGGYNSLAWAVNDAGEVVGFSTTTVPDANAMILQLGLPYAYQTRAFHWKDGKIEDLGTLGGPDAEALGINERGQIIGNSYISLDKSPACGALTTGAFLWEHGKMTNLGSLGGTCTNVSAINESGQIVGGSYLAGDEVVHPFLWERNHLRDLGTIGGNSGFAAYINDAGDVAGWQTLANEPGVQHATIWSGGRITDLGSLGPALCSFPNGINVQKQVAGVSGACSFDDPTLRAFLWQPGHRMVDLNTLISPKLGVQLRSVATINDRGEMAAVAVFSDGNRRPVLLVPCNPREPDVEACQDTAVSNTIPGLRMGRDAPPATTHKDRSAAGVPIQTRTILHHWSPR